MQSDEPSRFVARVLVDQNKTSLKKVLEPGGIIIKPGTPQGSSYRACFAGNEGIVFGPREEVVVI